MSNSRISIIVPFFNAERYLQRCIESVISQGFPDYELLLVDDGSDDKSPQIADNAALSEERIKVIHKQNEGALVARYTGFKEAKGEHLVFLDADDWLLPNALLILNDAITSDGGYDVVKSMVHRVNDKGDSWHEHYKKESGVIMDFMRDSFLDYIHPYLHSGIYKRKLFTDDIFKQIINSKLVIGEDWVANVLISSKVSKAKCIDIPSHAYFYNNESIMTTTVRSPKFPEVVENALGQFLISAPEDIQYIFKCKKVASYIMGCFKPEVPFSSARYELAKLFLNDNKNKNEIKKRVERKYLIGIQCPLFFKIYSWVYRTLYFNFILKRHNRKLYPSV